MQSTNPLRYFIKKIDNLNEDDIDLIYFVKDKVLVGGILLTHLQNLPCNAHEISEIEIPAGSVKDSAQTEIGNTHI